MSQNVKTHALKPITLPFKVANNVVGLAMPMLAETLQSVQKGEFSAHMAEQMFDDVLLVMNELKSACQDEALSAHIQTGIAVTEQMKRRLHVDLNVH